MLFHLMIEMICLFQVYNVIPSISAITGISPERYIWRISIALHVGPRILIASLYYYYYLSLAHNVFPANKFPDLPQLISFLYWLNIIEISALMGVTYISNQDNYRKLYTDYFPN